MIETFANQKDKLREIRDFLERSKEEIGQVHEKIEAMMDEFQSIHGQKSNA